LFQNKLGCASCHQDTNQGRGPALKGIFGKDQKLTNGDTAKVNEDYIKESILNPQAKIAEGYQPIMPTFKGQVTEDQINHLVAYIKSLNPNAATTTGTPIPTPAAKPASSPTPAANKPATTPTPAASPTAKPSLPSAPPKPAATPAPKTLKEGNN
jgi:cytochrome c oxidase subunit 2